MQKLQNEKKFTALSCFSGGGLLDYGLMDSFDIVWANELHAQPALCYKHNIGEHIVVGDFEQVLTQSSLPTVDVVVGGPPCFDYTSNNIAARGQFGRHGKLVWAYLEGIKRIQPKAFLFENVLGLYQRYKSALQDLIDAFEEYGYIITVGTLNASDFGVAQSRSRIFIVGIRKDLNFSFQFPRPPYIHKTVGEAIGDLPFPTELHQRIHIPNHVVTWTSPTPERIHDLIEHPRNQWVGVRRLDWNSISPMIGFNIGKDGRAFLHPVQDRRITVREFLRLMGFDDSFVIPDDVKLTNQYKLIGNGVAFPVAKVLGQSIDHQLRAHCD